MNKRESQTKPRSDDQRHHFPFLPMQAEELLGTGNWDSSICFFALRFIA
jgi:hypothetical protein